MILICWREVSWMRDEDHTYFSTIFCHHSATSEQPSVYWYQAVCLSQCWGTWVLLEGQNTAQDRGPSPCFPGREAAGSEMSAVFPVLLCNQMLLGSSGSWEWGSAGQCFPYVPGRKKWAHGRGGILFGSEWVLSMQRGWKTGGFLLDIQVWLFMMKSPIIVILDEGDGPCLAKLLHLMVDMTVYIFLRVNQGLNTLFRKECPGTEAHWLLEPI